MKRVRATKICAFLSLLLCIQLCVCSVVLPVQAEDLEDDYTQAEKMQRQVELGSGLRGAMRMAVTGESGWAQFLAPLNNTEFQLRMILSGDEISAQMYAVKNETETAQTEIYKDTDNWYMKTGLLLDSVLSLPARGDLISSLTDARTQGNPSFDSFMLRFLLKSMGYGNLQADSMKTLVQTWMENYAAPMEVYQGEAGTQMRFAYEIPAEDVKREIMDLLVLLTSSDDHAALQTALRDLMTQEQADLLLNPDMQWYIEDVLQALPLSGDITYTREVTMQGQEKFSEIYLPLEIQDGTWTELTIQTVSNHTTYLLSGPGQVLSWMPESMGKDHYRGSISLERQGADSYALTYDVTTSTERSVDEEDYHHETITYVMLVSPDEEHAQQDADYVTFDPIELQLRFHYYSKESKRSATTLDVTLSGLIPGGRMQAAAKFRTTTPWEITAMEHAGSISLAQKTTEERLEIAQDMLANLFYTLSDMDSAKMAETGTLTDLPDRNETEPAGEEDLSDEVDDTEQLRDDPDIIQIEIKPQSVQMDEKTEGNG